MNLHVKKIGEGFPVFLLHGLFGLGDNLLSLAKKLSSDFTVYMIDQRNHGQSFHSSEMNYDLMAEDVFRIFQSENISSAHMIGHSMGGKTAMMFTALYSAYIEKLCVVDIAPKVYAPHHNQLIRAMKSVPFHQLKSRNEVDAYLEKEIPEVGVRQFLLKNLKRTGSGYTWKMNLDGITKNYSSIAGFPHIMPVTTETCFIAGGNSSYITEDDEADIYALFPNSEIEYIDGAGHWVHAEKPIEFEKKVRSFLT